VITDHRGAVNTSALAHQLGQGTLCTLGLDPATVRALMQPGPGQPTETERLIEAFPSTNVAGQAPRPLLDEATGRPSNVAWLEGLREEAVGEHNYRQAAELHDLVELLRPRPPLTLRETAPAGVDAKACFFREHGVSRAGAP